MKSRTVVSALAALTLVLAGCTFSTVPDRGKGRVLIGAPKATTTRALGLTGLPPHAAKPTVKATGLRASAARTFAAGVHGRSVALARDLSAWDDIESMSYTITNLSTPSEEPLSDWIDPFYPFVDVYLTPGETYRIVVDIVPTAAAPGTQTGVTRFGDQADFVVDEYYDTYVNLYAHPTASPVINPGTLSNVAGNVSFEVLRPGDPWGVYRQLFSGAPSLSVSASDRFFYDPAAHLYYFNASGSSSVGALYQVSDINAPTDISGLPVLDGTDFTAAFTANGLSNPVIVAATADPSLAEAFWVVVKSSSNQFFIYMADTGGGVINLYYYTEITPDLQDGQSGLTPTITGIAVDNLFYDIYISYYSEGGYTVAAHSGVLEYYQGSLWTATPGFPFFQPGQPADSIATDVTYQQGRLWVTMSPVTSPSWSGTSAPNTGTAQVVSLDEWLNWYQDRPNPSRTFANTGFPVGNGQELFLPQRFLGPIQGSVMYLGQGDFANISGSVIRTTEFNLETGSVLDLINNS